MNKNTVNNRPRDALEYTEITKKEQYELGRNWGASSSLITYRLTIVGLEHFAMVKELWQIGKGSMDDKITLTTNRP